MHWIWIHPYQWTQSQTSHGITLDRVMEFYQILVHSVAQESRPKTQQHHTPYGEIMSKWRELENRDKVSLHETQSIVFTTEYLWERLLGLSRMRSTNSSSIFSPNCMES